ncbi:MAG: peptidylprolyl isomerase [Faecalicatena sp.]|uniref:peptidylprolyl isomerase n=1 Tax=Faecalicatena sp. TaxID=2005360 RepID=UPI0025871B7A|nr:peptidylprolyl isomerase [Faecalicatena sp.]MCI6465225.1 peptidylprolyl isomerase [Faecalicatena sp.]MDY5618590.1 peptidylprolyl isomerase [Lachnospiraceae bacterium]
MSQEVLAVVAGEEITQEEFDAFLHTVPRDRQAYISNPQFRKQCLDQLIALHLFAKMGENLELDKREEYEKILVNAKRDILAQMAMAEVMKDIKVTDEEAEDYYHANPKQFTRGATVSAKHILTETEETSSSILESITSGEKTFEDAAKEFSTCPSGAKGGDLGEFGQGQMVKEFEDAAFTAEIGHVVGPVKTQFGYHLIKVEDKKESSDMPFEDVKESIKMNLLQQKQNAAYSDKVNELRAKYVQE